MSLTIAMALDTAKSSVLEPIDAEVLLCYVLSVSRSYLYAYRERILTQEEATRFSALIAECLTGMPVAYLIGQREFWSLPFHVTNDTLIPRPETELLVETVLQLGDKKSMMTVADLGTGCGAIACAIAHERPQWRLYATDQSAAALAVAKFNAKQLAVDHIEFAEGSWCDALPAISFDIIVSNPPYIAKDDRHLQPAVLRFEPYAALIADADGLSDIQTIIATAPAYLASGGYLVLEHGFKQGESVRQLLALAHYTEIQTVRDLAGLERMSLARWI